MKVIWISFRKWNNAGGAFFTWQRAYIKGYRWTPFIVGKKRYV